jgi:DNA topoisomerase I
MGYPNCLVIVESGAKAKTISTYLNGMPNLVSKYGKFTVVACFGHIKDLKKKQLSIDVTNGYEPSFEVTPEKQKTVAELGKKIKTHAFVLLATDSDAEGAAISWHLREHFKLKNYKRITFNEITKAALEKAVINAGDIDMHQVNAQQTRRALDRLVGFNLTPLLWKKFASGGGITLSAGRVQSALLGLIIRREKEIEAFEGSSYWHYLANFDLVLGKGQKKQTIELEDARLYKDGVVHKTEDQKDVARFFKGLKNAWVVAGVKSKTTTQSPDAPFITSSLQQAASSKLRMGIKRVMAVAQELYEAGHITYMRTDSYNMSEGFKSQAHAYVLSAFGADYAGDGVLHTKKTKGAQEAHECIRITQVDVAGLPDKFDKDHRELYKMIWQRSVAFFMKRAVFDELEVVVKDSSMSKDKDAHFVSTFKKVKFNGYLSVYGVANETHTFADTMAAIDAGRYAITCKDIKAKHTWQSPPSRYNDAGLVKLMEKEGIARPSTFSATITKLTDKNYIIKTDIQGEEQKTVDFLFDPKSGKTTEVKGVVFVGAETSKVKPTDIGLRINSYLRKTFGYIVDTQFTAHMETDMDLVSEGKKTRLQVLDEFWKPFSKDLRLQMGKKEDKVRVESESREFVVDGTTYKVRIGQYGPLIEYESHDDEKKKYIGIKGYLAMAKKEYMDIDASDIGFLLSLPKKIGTVRNKDVMLVIGPYGLYMKHAGENVRIPTFAMKGFLETRSFTDEQIKSFVDYADEHRSADKDDSTKKEKTAKPKTAKPKTGSKVRTATKTTRVSTKSKS